MAAFFIGLYEVSDAGMLATIATLKEKLHMEYLVVPLAR